MELRPIRSKREHQAALKEAEALWDSPPGSPEADRLEVLTLLIEAYEREHFAIEARAPAHAGNDPQAGGRARYPRGRSGPRLPAEARGLIAA
jgi:hypothetical protein